ncbi:hypothetical protein [Tenggerimyces flavus]|uniref:DUF1453 domain-containing protein n=1 Tax=Tenggerimyces flavus TaxID=1708749 RepID=A0ABV7YPN7_9ACTN|nr:hypothetical protein [Tenggerimyces flavus]MBM7784389.1 hypothetical protein [Tenggerimyces flavus]
MTLSTLVNAALVVAVVIYMVARRMSWQQFNKSGREVWVMPLVLIGIGLLQMKDKLGGGYHLTVADIGFLVAGLAVSLVVGLLMGRTVELQTRGTEVWYRMPVIGLLVLVGYVAARFALAMLGHTMGATITSGGGSIMVSLGANLLAQSLVTASRVSTSTLQRARA